MDGSIILGLLNNIAVLLVLTMIYDYSWIRQETPFNFLKGIRTGAIIGGMGLILMMTPSTLSPGIVFDSRSILLSLSGLFFGTIPTVVAMIITGVYRLTLGGDGTLMGISVIITSGSIGIAWKYFRPNWKNRYYIFELLAMGMVVHLVMLANTVFLPGSVFKETFVAIAFPTMLIYPAGTILLGIVMVKMYKSWTNRKAKEQLSETERRFSSLLENVSMISVMYDTHGRILHCNRYFLELTGYTMEEVIGESWLDKFIHPDDRDEIGKVMEELISEQLYNQQFENDILKKDGSGIRIYWHNTILRSEEGGILGGASIGENVTQKRLEEEQLVEAKRKAEESDRLKSIFLTNMSHEIRTPMNAILGFTNLLSDNELPGPQKEKYVSIIKHSGNRLLQIINDILDISKLDAMQMSLQYSDSSLFDICINTFESFRQSQLLKEKSAIRISLDYPEELEELVLKTDCNRLQQVLDNLITNAIKYTDKGEIIFGLNLEDKGRKVRFIVSDTGRGIPKEVGDMVFERFRQVEEHEYHEGSGLGLSISKGLIKLLGGEIWYESEPGKGSTFYFTIPCYATTKIEIDKTVQEPGKLNLEGKHVIIAEDDEDSYYLLSTFFDGTNAVIHHAENGKSCLELLEKISPDLILLDINMPILSGFDCLKEIRDRRPNTMVIAQTAYAGSEERERIMNAGAHGFIAKPFDKQELFEVIAKVSNHYYR
ncbi:MAG: ATP-binding protein [Bacteroidales bacterium]